MEVRSGLVLAVAVLLLGMTLAQDFGEPTLSEEAKADFDTQVQVDHEMLQDSAKDYAKFAGQEYPAVVSLNEDDAGQKELEHAIGKKAAGALKQIGALYEKMKPQPIKPQGRQDLQGAMVESMARDYKKATGGKRLSKTKKPVFQGTKGVKPTLNQVMNMMVSVGKDVAAMKNKTYTGFQDHTKVIEKMKDRGWNPETMHVPDYDDNTLGQQSPEELAESLGLDPAEQSYQADKSAASSLLDQQEADSESVGADDEDDGDMIDDGDGEIDDGDGLPL